MDPTLSVRLDKWLWAVRLFKTRSLATEACRHGHITIAGQPAKASRYVKPNDIIVVAKEGVNYKFKVLQLLAARVGAQKVPEFAENQTPPSELLKPREKTTAPISTRPKGSGRPTKKQRRQLDRLFPEP
jgi:ribosome-associated heat shock protein Hsp15